MNASKEMDAMSAMMKIKVTHDMDGATDMNDMGEINATKGMDEMIEVREKDGAKATEKMNEMGDASKVNEVALARNVDARNEMQEIFNQNRRRAMGGVH